MKSINFIGSAFGYGAQVSSTSLGPIFIKNEYDIVKKLNQAKVPSYWYSTVQNVVSDLGKAYNKNKHYNAVLSHNYNLYAAVQSSIIESSSAIPFIIGGDHSCAIGTWLGVVDQFNANDDFGLIWIDAHMDAHTYETSPSKAYHGMPLSVLLGYGDKTLQSIGIGYVRRRINPKLLVLVGVRSYEDEEKEFLKSLGVRVIMIEEVRKRGIKNVFLEALSVVTKSTKGFGISFDLDAIDPVDAPAVNSPESMGMSWEETKKFLPLLFANQKLKAVEVTEFDPSIDQHDKTAEIILQTALMLGKHNLSNYINQ